MLLRRQRIEPAIEVPHTDLHGPTRPSGRDGKGSPARGRPSGHRAFPRPAVALFAAAVVAVAACGGTDDDSATTNAPATTITAAAPSPPPGEIVITAPSLYPEGLTYDPVGDRFIVGSLLDGRLVAVGDDGSITEVTEQSGLQPHRDRGRPGAEPPPRRRDATSHGNCAALGPRPDLR